MNNINKNKNRALREKIKQRKDHDFFKEWKIILSFNKKTNIDCEHIML